jgi:hypothetical protein
MAFVPPVVKYNKREYVVGRVLAGATLYFRAPSKAIAEAARAVFASWVKQLGAAKWQHGWWRHAVDWRAVKGEAAIAQRLAKADKNLDLAIAALDRDEPDAQMVMNHAPAQRVELSVRMKGGFLYDSNASSLRVALPIEDAPQVRELVIEACEELPIQSGFAGCVLVGGLMRRRDKKIDAALDKYVFDYPTLEIEEDFSNVMVKADRVRGVGWLTVLGAEAERVVGGEAKVKTKSVITIRTEHALIVQAGRLPLVTRDAKALAPYRAVHAAMKPAMTWTQGLTPDGVKLFSRFD